MAFTNERAFSFHLCYEEFDLKAASEYQRQPALMFVKANYLNMKIKNVSKCGTCKHVLVVDVTLRHIRGFRDIFGSQRKRN